MGVYTHYYPGFILILVMVLLWFYLEGVCFEGSIFIVFFFRGGELVPTITLSLILILPTWFYCDFLVGGGLFWGHCFCFCCFLLDGQYLVGGVFSAAYLLSGIFFILFWHEVLFHIYCLAQKKNNEFRIFYQILNL